MIILRIQRNCGQGNQMYMYSRAYALARKTNQKIIIYSESDLWTFKDRPYILDKFKLDKDYIKKVIRIDKIKIRFLAKIIRKILTFYYTHYPNCYNYEEEPGKDRVYNEIDNLNYKNYYLHGFFESYKYFSDYREELISQFEPNFKIDEETLDVFNKIKTCNSVALHIRRGDFVELGRSISTNYYKKMISKIEKRIESPIFYLATTDKNVIDEFSNYNNVKIIDTQNSNKDITDWLCLKYCKYHMITTSTYSWWAAYLSNDADKIVFHPSFEEYEKFENKHNKQEYNDFYF